jgi:benzoylformate decarboxylase
MGTAILGDVALALEALAELAGGSERPAPEPRPEPGEPTAADPLSGSQALAALASVWPEDGIAVVESPSSTLAVRNRLRLSRTGSWYFGASGGLGFGISAAIGVQLAEPERPVVCVLGEGSAQYGITALWTAVAYRVPVTFLVLRNEDYSILKWFSTLENVSGAPGLDLPGLDVAAVARGYGMDAREVEGTDELAHALGEAIARDDGPSLVQARVAPGMWID